MADKKTDPEAEYFARLERENTEKLAAALSAEKAERERDARRLLHANHCGRCGGALLPRPFRGVEIDVCADCGVVLLDPGELDQLAGHDRSGVLSSLSRLFTGKVEIT